MAGSAPLQLDLIAWNAKVGRPAHRVATALDRYIRDVQAWPDVMVLCEAGAYARTLRDRFGDRYRVRRAGRAHDGMVLLIDRRIPLTRWRTLVMRLTWIGPKAFKRHPGRTFPVADLGTGRGTVKWRIVGIHRTPGGPSGGVLTKGRNKPAWDEEHVRLVRLAGWKGSQRRSLVLVGDQNCEADDKRPHSGLGLASEIGARVIRTGAKVDWAIVRGAHGKGQRLDDYGSDHPLIRYSLTAV